MLSVPVVNTVSSISTFTEPPKLTAPPLVKPVPALIVTALFASLAFAIDPANWALLIVPTRLEVGYPVASTKLNAGVRSLPLNDKLIPP